MQLDLRCNRYEWLFFADYDVGDDLQDGEGQLLFSLMALTCYHSEREPVIGTTVHPLRMSLFVYLDFMTV